MGDILALTLRFQHPEEKLFVLRLHLLEKILEGNAVHIAVLLQGVLAQLSAGGLRRPAGHQVRKIAVEQGGVLRLLVKLSQSV